MLINKIHYHNVICQDIFNQGERPAFEQKENPWKGTCFPGVKERRIKNGI
jgi:hypothetical protein